MNILMLVSCSNNLGSKIKMRKVAEGVVVEDRSNGSIARNSSSSSLDRQRLSILDIVDLELGDKEFKSMVNKILESGADVNERDKKDNTILYFLLMEGSFNKCKYLIREKGADVNVKKRGYTLVSQMVSLLQIEACKCLMEEGANV